MAFSGIEDPQDCQVVWTIFAEKKKNVDACRRYLMKGMTDLQYLPRILIDGGIYLEQDTMKAILELRFNPGKVLHMFSLLLKDSLSFAAALGPTMKPRRLKNGNWL
jgi:hypothetical protein